MTRRGVVLSVRGRAVTVLCPGGEVRTVPWTGQMPSVGQEILVGAPGAGQWSAWGAAAAVMLLVVGGVWHALRAPAAPAASPTAVVAAVSVDINPSVELMVSRAGRVVAVRAYDAAGTRLVRTGPQLKGETLVGAVEAVQAWARSHGYLTASHPVVMLAGWADSPREAETVAGDLHALMVALQRHTVPGSVLALPLATGSTLGASERAGLSLGRYLLAGMLGKTPAAVAKVPLAQLFQAWPPRETASLSSHHPKAPAVSAGSSHGPGHGTEASAGSNPASNKPAQQSPVVPGTGAQRTVSGQLTGLGPDDVLVSGHAYPLTSSVSITIAGAAVRFSLGRVLGNLQAPVVLTLNSAGQVVSIAVQGGSAHGR